MVPIIYSQKNTLTQLYSNITELGQYGTSTNSSSNVSVPSGSYKNVDSITLPSAGIWIVSAALDFQTNSSGIRKMVLNTSSSTAGESRNSVTTVLPIPSGETFMTMTKIYKTTEPVTLYLHAYQNSGATLTVYPYISKAKIAPSGNI